jgi:GNAT superfamily N-acetyltransferase
MIEVRAATDDDLPAVLDLLQASLGWVPNAQYEAFFHWKHHENPFGRSAAWVAVDGARVIGFRTFLRWQWERDGETVSAVRAVDTATHPDAQGKGVFRTLTMHAVDALRDEGVGFVFNTPNAQSRPGYLKMGWLDIGRPVARVRPRSPLAAARLLSARVPADKWSLPTSAGVPITDALADVDALLTTVPAPEPGVLRTARTPALLRWRYGFEPLAYRAEPIGATAGDGVVVFRLRRRGPVVEATIADVLAPPGSTAKVRAAIRRLLRASGAHYAIAIGPARSIVEGLVALPRQGPRLTWRALVEIDPMPLAAWDVGLGDIELF